MPIARVKLPDGRIGRFNVPEGTTPEQVIEFANQQGMEQKATPVAQQPASQPVTQQQAPTYLTAPTNAAQQQANKENFNNILARTGRIATGIVGAAADLPVVVGQSAYDLTRGVQAEFGMKQAPAYKVPLPSEGAKAVYDVLTKGAGKATGMAGSLDTVAEYTPALLSLAGAATKASKTLIPKVDDATKKLASQAMDKFGIPLRVDQVAPSRFTKTVQKVSQEVPLSGVEKFEDIQSMAFNKGLAKTLGEDADNLAPEVVQNFRTRINNQFNSVLKDKNINVSPDDVKKIESIKKEATKLIGRDNLGIVEANVDDVVSQLTNPETGKLELSGNKLSSIRSRLIDTVASIKNDAAPAVSKIVDALDDIANKNLSKAEVKLLAESRKQWRNFKTVQPALQKSVDGNINPTQLITAVKSNKFIDASKIATGEDDIVDLARIGKKFMVKAGGSDTAQKLTLTKIAGASALGTAPVAAGAAGGATAVIPAAIGGAGIIAANRGLQAANTSQRLVKDIISGNKPIGEINKLLSTTTTLRNLAGAGQIAGAGQSVVNAYK